MKKSTKIALGILIPTLTLLLLIGGIIMSFNSIDDFRRYFNDEETLRSSSKDDVKEDEEAIKEKQLAYLKEHEQEIVDFVKAQNSKIESVQIDWNDVRWGEAGNGTPQGGGKIVDIYGTFNHIEDSGWNVTIEINDGKPDMDTMMLSNGLGIGGQPFE